MISWIVAIGVLVGMADSLTGNHFKIGETFQRGFRLIGSMMISMAGIMALAPVIAGWIAPLILPLFWQLQMDPSIVSILMGNDMGGYQMAKSLAEDPQVGMMLGGITAGMFGGTLTFSIPLGFSLIQGDARKSFSKGMLIGIGCIPVGSIAGGLVLGIAPSKVLWNNIPVLFLTVLIVLGFVCMQDRLVKIMEIFGKIIEWTGTIGIGIGAFTYLTGICKSRPLTMLPTGIHPTPMRIPLENHGTSSFSIRPKPSGMVNVKVPPNIPAVTTPSIRPIFSFCASDIASG